VANVELPTNYFARDTTKVANELVGAVLVRRFSGGEVVREQITETEAYLGEEDGACHARRGKTKRTKVMYQEPGVLYLYLIYGMYDMLNIVTRKGGEPEAVLIRATEDCNGPGILTRELNIAKDNHNGEPLGKETGVWIEERPESFDVNTITAKPRVGIDYAEPEWQRKKLRFTTQKD
jgi:DNA-3-methyladenine glycosylase